MYMLICKNDVVIGTYFSINPNVISAVADGGQSKPIYNGVAANRKNDIF